MMLSIMSMIAALFVLQPCLYTLYAEETKPLRADTSRNSKNYLIRYALSHTEHESQLLIQGNADLKNFRSFYLKSPSYHFVLDIPYQWGNCSGNERMPVDRDELRSVRIACHPDKIRFVLYLGEHVECQVRSENDGLRVNIGRSESAEPLRVTEPTAGKELQTNAAPDAGEEHRAEAEQSQEIIAACQNESFFKPKISCHFYRSDLRDFFSLLSQTTQKPIELSPDVHGQITMRLDDISCDQALDMIVTLYGLQVTVKGDGLYIQERKSRK